jgi:excinuclease UvrABC nuclease subunit
MFYLIIQVKMITPIEEIFDLAYKGKKGIYFLFDKGVNLIYIGMTKNIRRRIYQHLYSLNKKFPDNFIKYFCFVELSEDNFVFSKELEDKMIKFYKPLFNNVPFENTQKIIEVFKND